MGSGFGENSLCHKIEMIWWFNDDLVIDFNQQILKFETKNKTLIEGTFEKTIKTFTIN